MTQGHWRGLLVALPAAFLVGCAVPGPEPAAEAPAEVVPVETAPEPAPVEMSLREAQQRLAEMGYPVGAVDGIMGPRTAAALRAYQQEVDLPVTGVLDEDTRSALSY